MGTPNKNSAEQLAGVSHVRNGRGSSENIRLAAFTALATVAALLGVGVGKAIPPSGKQAVRNSAPDPPHHDPKKLENQKPALEPKVEHTSQVSDELPGEKKRPINPFPDLRFFDDAEKHLEGIKDQKVKEALGLINDEPYAWLRVACREFYDNDDAATALRIVDHVIAIDPKGFFAHRLRAEIRLSLPRKENADEQKKELENALSDLTIAIERHSFAFQQPPPLFPNFRLPEEKAKTIYSDAYMLRAHAHEELGNFAQAIRDLNTARFAIVHSDRRLFDSDNWKQEIAALDAQIEALEKSLKDLEEM